MCGICGAIQLDDGVRLPLGQHVLDRVADVLQHRGPDDRGTHLAPGVAIGARRLSIVDLAGGHQPLANEDGTIWVAFNGEIYNQRKLREDLNRHGHRFATRTDTEVLVHLYEDYGEELLHVLDGMFAFALW